MAVGAVLCVSLATSAFAPLAQRTFKPLGNSQRHQPIESTAVATEVDKIALAKEFLLGPARVVDVAAAWERGLLTSRASNAEDFECSWPRLHGGLR